MTDQRVTMITLATSDLSAARAFYERLGWKAAEGSNETVVFFKLAGQFFSIYSRDALVNDIGMPIGSRCTGNATLATNFGSRTEVDAAYAKAMEAGAVAISKPQEVFWGGYSGMVADPDGHLWEYAHNPFWKLDENGQVTGEP